MNQCCSESLGEAQPPPNFPAKKPFRKIAYGVEMLCYYLTQSHPQPFGLFFIQLSLQQESGA
jgi:hypothetical protein